MPLRALFLAALLFAPAGALAQQAPGARPERLAIEPAQEIPENFQYGRDRRPIAREWPMQPPLIPHTIKGYHITRNFNRCLDCHSRARSEASGATPVGDSHYLNREGRLMANISTRRYFCVQCHVPQVDAKPLVENTFRPLGVPAGKGAAR